MHPPGLLPDGDGDGEGTEEGDGAGLGDGAGDRAVDGAGDGRAGRCELRPGFGWLAGVRPDSVGLATAGCA
jgi:hypothetical protein